MKKISLVFTGIVAVSMIFTSCKKDIMETNISKSNINISNPTEESLINLASSKEEVEFRKVKLIFGKALEEIVKNKKFVDLIINDAKVSKLKQAQLKRIALKNEEFRLALNLELSKYIQMPNVGSREEEDLLAYLETLLSYQNTEYIATIVIPNLEIMDENLPPYVSPGLDVDEEVYLVDDGIYAIKYDEDYNKTVEILDEETAKSEVKPIFIFANGVEDRFDSRALLVTEDDINLETLGELKTTNGDGSRSVRDWFEMENVKSNTYFYDANGTNNYSVLGAYKVGNNWFGRGMNDINNFTRAQCNGVLKRGSNGSYVPSAGESSMYVFNTYERDWYASKKFLGNYGSSVFVAGRMTLSSEWYINNPYIFNSIYNNFTSSKSDIRVV